jgi:hypothetical protein
MSTLRWLRRDNLDYVSKYEEIECIKNKIQTTMQPMERSCRYENFQSLVKISREKKYNIIKVENPSV